MNKQILRLLFVVGMVIVCCLSISSAGIVTNNNLEISVSMHSNIIPQNGPVVVTFRVKNMSPVPMQVMSPCFGSMDVVEAARASVVVSIEPPGKKSIRIDYAKPFIGPVREIEHVKISPEILEPNQELVAYLLIGGAWSPGSEHTIFAHEGLYSVSLTYYPFITTNTENLVQIDYNRAIHIPAFTIMVSEQTLEDAATWKQIQKLKHWWILYEPNIRNAEYLSDTEQQELECALARLAREHNKSSYRKYIEYGIIALQTVRKQKGELLPVDIVEKLKRLADDQDFAYSSYAQALRTRIKQ